MGNLDEGTGTYRLTPGPSSGHEVLILAPPVRTVHSLCSNIDLRLEVRIFQLAVKHGAGIAKIDGVRFNFPRGRVPRSHIPVVGYLKRFPLDVARLRGVDGT